MSDDMGDLFRDPFVAARDHAIKADAWLRKAQKSRYVTQQRVEALARARGHVEALVVILSELENGE